MLSQAIPEYLLLPFNIVPSERRYGDCRTKAFKQLLEHYCFNYSTQEIFGIGQRLSFNIQKVRVDKIDLLGIHKK